MRKVTYRVKSDCGLCDEGDEISAYLIGEPEEEELKLLYIPRQTEEYNVGCIISCIELEEGLYEEVSEESYVNLEKPHEQMFLDNIKRELDKDIEQLNENINEIKHRISDLNREKLLLEKEKEQLIRHRVS